MTSHANRIELREQHVRKISRSRDGDPHTFIANNTVQQQEEAVRSMVRQYKDNADAKSPPMAGFCVLSFSGLNGLRQDRANDGDASPAKI